MGWWCSLAGLPVWPPTLRQEAVPLSFMNGRLLGYKQHRRTRTTNVNVLIPARTNRQATRELLWSPFSSKSTERLQRVMHEDTLDRQPFATHICRWRSKDEEYYSAQTAMFSSVCSLFNESSLSFRLSRIWSWPWRWQTRTCAWVSHCLQKKSCSLRDVEITPGKFCAEKIALPFAAARGPAFFFRRTIAWGLLRRQNKGVSRLQD